MRQNRDNLGGQSLVRVIDYSSNSVIGFDIIENVVGSWIYNDPSSTAYVQIVPNARNTGDNSYITLWPGDALECDFSNVRVICPAQWNTVLKLEIGNDARVWRGGGSGAVVSEVGSNVSIATATHAQTNGTYSGTIATFAANVRAVIHSAWVRNAMKQGSVDTSMTMRILAAPSAPGGSYPVPGMEIVSGHSSREGAVTAVGQDLEQHILISPGLVLPAGWGLYYWGTSTATAPTSLVAPEYGVSYTLKSAT